MLALVQVHNVLWFLPVTLAGAVLFAITTTLRNRGVAMRPVIPAACWCLTAGGIAGMIVVKCWDNRRLRDELREIEPAGVSRLTVTRDQAALVISDPATAAEIMGALRSIKGLAAHHSHPVDPVEVTFDFRGEFYRYRVARDSGRPQEYWVINVRTSTPQDGGLDFGRFESAEWGKMVETLFAGKK